MGSQRLSLSSAPFSTSSSATFWLSGRFLLLNNILCKTAGNDGAFRPSQIFFRVPHDEEEDSGDTAKHQERQRKLDDGHEVLDDARGSQERSIPLCSTLGAVLQEKRDTYQIQTNEVDPHRLHSSDEFSFRHGSRSMESVSFGESLSQMWPTGRSITPERRGEREEEWFIGAQRKVSAVTEEDESLEEGVRWRSTPPLEKRCDSHSEGMGEEKTGEYGKNQKEGNDRNRAGMSSRSCGGEAGPLGQHPASSSPPSSSVTKTVYPNPNCFLLHTFGIASGGALLDSLTHHVIDMADTTLVSSRAMVQGLVPEPEAFSLSPSRAVHSDDRGAPHPNRKAKRERSVETPLERQKKKMEESTAISSSNTPMFHPSCEGMERHHMDRKTAPTEEEDGEPMVFALPPLLEEVLSCLPSSRFHAPISLDTIPTRNLLLYAEGCFQDVVAEAHYSFLSSIEPLNFQGTFATPLRFPRGAHYHERSIRRCGAARFISNAIWGKLCVLKDTPLLYYRKVSRARVKEQDPNHLPLVGTDGGDGDVGETEEGNTMDSDGHSSSCKVDHSRHGMQEHCARWKKWVTVLEVFRRAEKAIHVLPPGSMGTSFPLWVAPHNVYPQLGGERVRLQFPLRLQEWEHFSRQPFFPLFYRDDFGISSAKVPQHARRESQCTWYRIFRSLSREFRPTQALWRRGEKHQKKGIQFLPGGEIGWSTTPTRQRDYWLLFHRFFPVLQIEKVNVGEDGEEVVYDPSRMGRSSRQGHSFWGVEDDSKEEEEHFSNSRLYSEARTIFRFSDSERFSARQTLARFHACYGKFLSPAYHTHKKFSFKCSSSSSVADHLLEDQRKTLFSKNGAEQRPYSGNVEKYSNSEADAASAWDYLLRHDRERLYGRLQRLISYFMKVMSVDYGML